MHDHDGLTDRAVGGVLASAIGDALGSHYEFGPAIDEQTPLEFGVGYFGHRPYEWTDDTSMAVPILDALADGARVDDPAVLAGILQRWVGWAGDARDVGSQTGIVLAFLGPEPNEEAACLAARAVHERYGRSGGNGALMRTGPLALGFLHRPPTELVTVAGRIARLTHYEQDNVDACGLWTVAIRHAILTGDFDPGVGLLYLPAERRTRWAGLLDEAMEAGAHPRDFADQNGWVVAALQGAVAAINGAAGLVDALERAVRGGADTDTVAAITGALAGACWGSAQLPPEWVDRVHGWPGYTGADLVGLTHRALSAARG